MSLEVITRQVDLSDADIQRALILMMAPTITQAAHQAAQTVQQSSTNNTGNLPLFIAPPDLATWNSLLGATQITKIAPVEVVLYGTITSGAVNQAMAYDSPPGYVSTAMAGFLGTFQYHSLNLTVEGFLNYGTPSALPITAGPIILENDLDINRVVASGHQVRYNLTLLFTNGTAYDVPCTLRTTFLQVPEGLFNQLYATFEQQVQQWMQAIAAGQYQGGAHA